MSDESDSTIELNRRRVLAGLGTIGVASAGAGAGTFALFSDTETSSGNTVQAGTLDLSDGVSSESFSVGTGSDGLKPGDKGEAYFGLTNDGTLDGSLDFTVSNVSVSQARSSEAKDEYTAGEYTVTRGTFFAGDPSVVDAEIPFGDVGLDAPQTTTVNLNESGQHEIIVDTVADVSNGGLVELILDPENNGFDAPIYRIGVKYNQQGPEGEYFKKDDGSGYSQEFYNTSPSDSRIDSIDYDGDRLKVMLDAGAVSTPFGLTGYGQYANTLLDSGPWGTNNFYVGVFPSDVDGSFGTRNDHLLTMDSGTRNIDNLLLTRFAVDTNFGTDADLTDGDETEIAEGRLDRVAGPHYDTNEGLNSGTTKALVMEYELPTDAGNAVQGEEVQFDVEVELNQENSQ